MKPYTEFTLEELLSKLVYLGGVLCPPEDKIEAVKTEIRKRIRLVEAHSGKT